MKTYDEVLDAIDTIHTPEERILRDYEKRQEIIKEVFRNPRTRILLMSGIDIIGKEKGIVDPYSAASHALAQGILIGLMMNSLYDDE